MNDDPNRYPDKDKTARHMNPYPIFVLLPSFRTNSSAKFVVEAGYSFMSSCFVRVRVRIRVSIHKQRHMGRYADQPTVTSDPVCAR